MSDSSVDLQAVMAAHRAGRLDEAETGYLQFLAAHPDDPDALHFLGLLRLHQDRPDDALELVTRSVTILPGNPHAWNNLGNLLLNAGREEEALAAWQRAAGIAPEMVEAIYNMGVLLRRRRRPADAIAAFAKVISATPKFSPAWENLASLLYRMGRTEDAADAYRRWLEVDPDNPIARHMVAATSGADAPDRADRDYVSRTFDEFASSFDVALQRLDYAAPQLLAGALGERVGFGRRNLAILDAGCGTGLCGLLLRSSARTLIGVDLSSKMLEKAAAREIYDELVEADLCEFMRSRAGVFDVVASADTLLYFGSLDEPFSAARLALKPAGVFAFTVEAGSGETPGFALLPHGRYSHGGRYVEDRLIETGFIDIRIEDAVLRKEVGRDVAGYLVLANVPA